MRELEQRFAREMVVIGVHSGKYHAERVTSRIRDAALRLGNLHPIVNDRQFRIWRSYAVNAWPTIAVIDPAGYVVGMQPGEFTAGQIAPYLEDLIHQADEAGTLVRSELRFPADAPTIAPGALRYPGKVALDAGRLAIADSGHDRIIVGVLTEQGRALRVGRVVGDGAPGFTDGDAPRFRMPQGLCFAGDTLYVADAGNHAIRAIRLADGVTRTVAGTGQQLRTRADLRAGALSSPWDVTVAGDTLFVAMAGVHQLWAIDAATGRARVHSGSGREGLFDGPQREAALAQPMGIVHDGERLFFADAESSAVRWADVDPEGLVGTIVGTGLFDFGDRDGIGDDVRLQHPQGIDLAEDGRLLVADSYNDAVKWIDPATRGATTWRRELHEPGGVALAGRVAYVADTNAHRIAILDRVSGAELGALALEGLA